MSNVPAVRIPDVVPAGAGADRLTFGEMLRRAEVLAKTELVPKPLQGKPEAIVVIGVWGAEHGVPLMTAIQEVHVIENRPSPSAQLRLALIRRAGHEVRFVESDAGRAVLRARRREYARDPEAWVTVTYTIDDARRAGLLDVWVEQWESRRPVRVVVGDDRALTGPPTGAPEWAAKAFAAGDVRRKDNWHKYPADMLRARAASVMSRMEFSDVMAALGVDDHTPEERGVDLGQDLDEPADTTAGEVVAPADDADGAQGEVIEDAVIEEDFGSAPGDPDPPVSTETEREPPPTPPEPAASGTLAGAAAVPPMPTPSTVDRDDIAGLKERIVAGITPVGWAGLVPWLEACGINPNLNRLSAAKVGAVHHELDQRGIAKIPTAGDDVPPPPPIRRTDG